MYTNRMSVNISDIARLIFHDECNGITKEVAQVSMHFEALLSFVNMLNNVVAEHEEKLKADDKKKLSAN